jgi:ABC-type branched-subunit amino acid transport system substrate-binding protein
MARLRTRWTTLGLHSLLLGGLLVLLVPLSGCQPPQPQTYTIASAMTDIDDPTAWEAVELAVKQNTNLPNGDSVAFIHSDDQGIPATGVKNINTLLQNSSVMAAVGPYRSSIAFAEVPTLQAAPINSFALISPATTHPCLTVDVGLPCPYTDLHPKNTLNYFFRIPAHDRIQGQMLARLAYNRGYRRAYVIGFLPPGPPPNMAYGTDLADAFQKAFATMPNTSVVGSKIIGPADLTDHARYFALVQGILGTNPRPDVVFYGGSVGDSMYPDGAALAQGLWGVECAYVCPPNHLALPVEVGDAIASNPNWLTQAGPASGNTFGVAPVLDAGSLSSVTRDYFTYAYCASGPPGYCTPYGRFLRDFHAIYQTYPTPYAAMAYGAAMVEITAIKKLIAAGAPVTRKNVRDQAASMQYGGITGRISFDANGDNMGPWPFTVWDASTDSIGVPNNSGIAWQAGIQFYS